MRLPVPSPEVPVLLFQLLLTLIALVLLVLALLDGSGTLALLATMMLVVALSGVLVAWRRERRSGRR
ncbi:hypothetical protein MRU69_08705 [Kocuria flava]|uniref:hypothetical protein n=1 Tax=Kocuria flava TaxID=446860 RepID=UPI001FF3DFDD|nr:hypothetical protein [Kocuria flava]MCJ8504944.1 hypothetical protein [Kocuria flava]